MITEFVEDSKEKRYPVSKIASNEWKEFAMYTVESRAIPNMIDGNKPVQRMFLYSSIATSKTEFKKVSAVAGVVSQYGYNHGESSAAGAGQLMAAEWNNNICLIEGRGSFGTRLIPAAAAPRYTYTRLHSNFTRYVRDIDLAPAHSDPEHEPPAFYIPIIPLVLANGAKGIATGFATNILPRDPKDIVRACKQYVTTGRVGKKVKIKFPDFKGTVEYDKDTGKYTCRGLYHKKSKTVLSITEIPYGTDREGYVTVLDKLEESGDIVGYDDLCSKDGFMFDVKLKQATSAKWDNIKIEKMFKLTKPLSENLTVIDYDGKLREYKDERDLIKDFCDYRAGILAKRISLRLTEFNEDIRWLGVKMAFIQAIIGGKITFKNKKRDAVAKQIVASTDATQADVDRLLRINIISLTAEMVEELKEQQEACEGQLKFWKSTTPNDQFVSDLSELLSAGK